VQLWQKNKQDIAYFHHKTSTLLGRNRNLNKFFTGNLTSSSRGLWMRRSINTPIQGGAADIVIAAMIKISQNERLK
jgi:DNA polymerase-1